MERKYYFEDMVKDIENAVMNNNQERVLFEIWKICSDPLDVPENWSLVPKEKSQERMKQEDESYMKLTERMKKIARRCEERHDAYKKAGEWTSIPYWSVRNTLNYLAGKKHLMEWDLSEPDYGNFEKMRDRMEELEKATDVTSKAEYEKIKAEYQKAIYEITGE